MACCTEKILKNRRKPFLLVRWCATAGVAMTIFSIGQSFTSQFIPDAYRDLQHSLNQMQRLAATPHMADRFMRANADVNVVGELSKIKTPTLVMHTTGDLRVPYSFAQEIAAGIPGLSWCRWNFAITSCCQTNPPTAPCRTRSPIFWARSDCAAPCRALGR